MLFRVLFPTVAVYWSIATWTPLILLISALLSFSEEQRPVTARPCFFRDVTVAETPSSPLSHALEKPARAVSKPAVFSMSAAQEGTIVLETLISSVIRFSVNTALISAEISGESSVMISVKSYFLVSLE